MDKDTLLFLLKGKHIDMPTRIEKGIWPHPPILFNECIETVCEYLHKNKYFPDPWVEKRNGEPIGDVDIIEKKGDNKFVYRYRYSSPINLLTISDSGEKKFSTAEQVVEYYLRHVLRLPGDIDGWQVI